MRLGIRQTGVPVALLGEAPQQYLDQGIEHLVGSGDRDQIPEILDLEVLDDGTPFHAPLDHQALRLVGRQVEARRSAQRDTPLLLTQDAVPERTIDIAEKAGEILGAFYL